MDGFRQGFDEIIYEYAGFILERNDKISVICVTVFFLEHKESPRRLPEALIGYQNFFISSDKQPWES